MTGRHPINPRKRCNEKVILQAKRIGIPTLEKLKAQYELV